MKILVAEDERITRRNIQRHLEKWGHEVITAEKRIDCLGTIAGTGNSDRDNGLGDA